MANHKSALKRVRQNENRRLRNKILKTKTKNVIKEFKKAVSEESGEKVLSSLDLAKSVIDKAAKKGALHKRTAARKISRITKMVNKI